MFFVPTVLESDVDVIPILIHVAPYLPLHMEEAIVSKQDEALRLYPSTTPMVILVSNLHHIVDIEFESSHGKKEKVQCEYKEWIQYNVQVDSYDELSHGVGMCTIAIQLSTSNTTTVFQRHILQLPRTFPGILKCVLMLFIVTLLPSYSDCKTVAANCSDLALSFLFNHTTRYPKHASHRLLLSTVLHRPNGRFF